jgi:hypothetical protein
MSTPFGAKAIDLTSKDGYYPPWGLDNKMSKVYYKYINHKRRKNYGMFFSTSC